MTGRARPLLGRAAEVERLAAVVRGARDGTSGALVLLGDPGIGKSALLHAAAAGAGAAGCRVVEVVGHEAERAIPHAALDRLLRPLRQHVDALPPHHAAALRRAVGVADGPAPDPFLVGLAVLELLAAAGQEQPVLCLVDDAHLVDAESLAVLAFVARRLHAEPVALLLAARDEEALVAATAGVPVLRVGGLPAASAAALLRSALRAPVDPLIATRVAAATGGNPLALIDLAEELTVRELTDTGLRDEPVPLGRHLEAHYARRIEGTAAATRTWLLVAAADSTGDLALVDRACRSLGVGDGAAVGAEDAGLVDLRPVVRFRHPLVRATAYATASGRDRRDAHAALSAAAGAAGSPELEAWHAGEAVPGTSEEVAARLERVADLAAGRGGHLSRARVLARAAELSPPGPARARRRVAAAHAAVQAGAVRLGTALLDEVEDAGLAPVDRARAVATRVTAGVFVAEPDVVVRATAEMLRAAALFHGHDPVREEDALLRAFDYALSAGHLRRDVTLVELGGRLRAAAAERDGHAAGVLAALAALLLDPFGRAVPALRRGLALIQQLDGAAAMPYMLAEVALTTALWDADARRRGLDRSARTARDSGALRTLDTALWTASVAELTGGSPRRAGRLVEGVRELRRAIGYEAELVTNAAHLAWVGAPRAQVEAVGRAAGAAGFGAVESGARSALAVRDLARSRYRDAYAELHAQLAAPFLQVTPLLLPDYVEASVRTGHHDDAHRAAAEMLARADASGSPWARGVALRCRALVSQGPEADESYAASVDVLDTAGVAVEAARSRMLHGEWLRRGRRRAEARAVLRGALAGFAATDATVFADRVTAELRAVGDTGTADPGGPASPLAALTPREQAVARMAARGDTNAEIGATLFISANTVDYHLRKVFAKLAITSRRQLREHLDDD
ncbi:AAA family ATPase [Cellulomonas sp. NPDC058312]|uniref:helix-turn-helix transcriptional regulator n=1 Tax=Cellulomonas sp. NPDC058312 TaxID=3346441 RepID=UPI0036E6C1DC